MTAKENLIEFPAPMAPVFDVGGKLIVNCRSLNVDEAGRWLPVTVTIEPKFMPKGTHVMVHSVGTVDATGREEIPGTKFNKEHTVTGGEEGGVFQVNIPYLTSVKPIQQPQESGGHSGFIKIWYTFELNGNPTKSHVFSREVKLLASGLYCEGVPV